MKYWLLLILGISILFPTPVHAYLDPGSGSMILQLLLAGFAGVAVAIKVFWRRIIAFFTGQSDKKD